MLKCDFNKVQNNVIEITLLHGSSPVNLLHIFGRRFPKNTSGWLLLKKDFRKKFDCRKTQISQMMVLRGYLSLSLSSVHLLHTFMMYFSLVI